MILKISNGKLSKYKVVLKIEEIFNLIPHIDWIKDDIYIYTSKNDKLSEKEKKSIIDSNPHYDFLISNDCIEIDNVICRDFNIVDFFKIKSQFVNNKTALIIGEQINPIDNCPAFSIGNYLYVWRCEISLFEVLFNNQSIGFYNSITRSIVFKKISQYDKYIEEVNFFKSKLENYMEKEKEERFVRVITVYDKYTKELKYRILNEEFNYNSFAHINIQPFENDEFFLKSYLITKKLAKEYSDWAYIDVDYDFSKNEYYFETLNAETLTYSVAEVFKEISTK